MRQLGIIALVLSILSVVIPLIGAYLTIVCAILIAFSTKEGFIFGILAFVINIINIIFLSPSLWITSIISLGSFGMFCILAQIIGLAILIVLNNKTKKIIN